MKKIAFPLFCGLILGAVIMYIVLAPKPADSVKSSGKNSYAQVTAKLDAGGDLYFYLNAEKVMKTAKTFFEMIGKAAETSASQSPADQAKATHVMAVISQFFENSGFSEISGLGASSVEMAPDLNHSKYVLYHRPDAGQGLIWHLAQSKPRELSELKMLPADTVLAKFGEFQVDYLWSWLKKQLEAAKLSEALTAVQKAEGELLKTGIPLEKVLNSFSGRMGYVLTLNEKKMWTPPMGSSGLEIPEPALALVFSVKDSTIFDLLSQKLPFAQTSEKDGWKKLQIPLPPMPFTVEPIIAWKSDLLIIASNNVLFQSLLEAKESGRGLTAGPEFKKYSERIPDLGNGFNYLSSRFFKTIQAVFNKVRPAETLKKEEIEVSKMLNGLFSKEMALYAVQQNTDEGLVFFINHSFDLGLAAFLPASAAAGMISAIAIPNMMKMKEAANKTKLKPVL